MVCLLPASTGSEIMAIIPSWASKWKMELSSNNSCYKKCKILSDQCLMLVFKFPIIIFIFTYSICHIRHKLTVTYFIKLDAVIFLSCVVIQKKLSSILTSFNRVFLQCIHFQIFRENSSHTFSKKVYFLMSLMSDNWK